MVAEVLAWNLHWIVSHGKNGSPTTKANQAGNSPQILCNRSLCAYCSNITVRLALDS